eukprot:171159-Amphidinium_carterae.1
MGEVWVELQDYNSDEELSHSATLKFQISTIQLISHPDTGRCNLEAQSFQKPTMSCIDTNIGIQSRKRLRQCSYLQRHETNP